MNIYCIFDDYPKEAINRLLEAGIVLTVHPKGKSRPNNTEMKMILQEYDGVIIGTSQRINEDMFEGIDDPRIIATASVGLDHIHVPENKKKHVTIINTPTANARSVAEYTIGCFLSCTKRFAEGKNLYLEGKNNKQLSKKPGDIYGKSLGVIGAGNISREIMLMAKMLGMNVFFWTPHPENHIDLHKDGMTYREFDQLISESDYISVNLPNNEGTKDLISERVVSIMKEDAVFVSVSRLPTVNLRALVEKAEQSRDFYVCLDIDVDDSVVSQLPNLPNLQLTPHIAGGTTETRIRMFNEIASMLVGIVED
ncbi:MAG: NAD(P)-dependent oxidoreductase [Erysipelotrichaceae bacterium]|nr:NAD(P)-dependent oxidoreductase [Erysipelotrichaceae bacterium]